MKKLNIPYFLLLFFIFKTAEIQAFNNFIGPKIKKTQSVNPPSITASGTITYCPLTQAKIVSSVTITHDPTDLTTNAVYIQIASGYVQAEDKLILTNTSLHPTIKADWNPSEGKLTLSSPTNGQAVTYADFEAAIQSVVFYSSNPSPSGTRNFSISLGNGKANYLPRNGHYYEYVPSLGITWSDAKNAAATRTLYGLQGYLATLTAADEAELAGKQAPGTGWIAGSDAETEGVWKWMAGPELGQVFNFSFWNYSEPNNTGGIEHYAHITDPNIPNAIRGSWNDLKIAGDASGFYQSKGYIVEYGGMPGDTPLQLAASTELSIAKVTNTTDASRCDNGIVTLKAAGNSGIIQWFSTPTGGSVLATGNSFDTPILSSSQTYYAAISTCPDQRSAVNATIHIRPTISVKSTAVSRCGTGSVTLDAEASTGIVSWYLNATGGDALGSGATFTTPEISSKTTFFAEAQNNGCPSNNRIGIEVAINPIPLATDENLVLCQGSPLEISALQSGMTYLWSTNETTPLITVQKEGTYFVDSTNRFLCTARKTITVVEHFLPEIEKVEVNQTQAKIILKNTAAYFEYAVDGLNFQKSSIFENINGGLHTAYVREINNCGSDTKNFVILLAPGFFTPNNDSYNDFWTVKGIQFYPQAKLHIFDRYGRLIKELSYDSLGWDGTFNGVGLPADDYWYSFYKETNAAEIRGHFSLKR